MMFPKVKFQIFLVIFLIYFIVGFDIHAQNSSFNNLEKKGEIVKLNSVGVQIGYSFISLDKLLKPHYRFGSSFRLLESKNFLLDFVFEYFHTAGRIGLRRFELNESYYYVDNFHSINSYSVDIILSKRIVSNAAVGFGLSLENRNIKSFIWVKNIMPIL